jgi:hypothetical protein
MEQFNLDVLHELDIQFTGKLIAEVEFKQFNSDAIWQIYKTEANRFVCYKVVKNDNKIPLETKSKICCSHDEIKKYFDLCEHSKSLYKQANINCALQVDELDLNSLKSQSQQNETSCNLEDAVYL